MTSGRSNSLFFSFIFLYLNDVSNSLKITSMTVPNVVLSGQSVRLSCYFKLEGDSLYSLTWWKGDLPFFSFVQANGPKISVFQLPGIFVDKDSSSLNEVFLAHVDHRASGDIKCEVVADYPSFEKDSAVHKMLVVERPTLGPKLTGRTLGYHVGDLLLLNCTSPSSYPPAKLTWSINSQQASTGTVIVYPVEEDGQGREASKSGLQMFLQHHHFHSGVLVVRCMASILELYGKYSEVVIRDMDFREPSRQGQIDRATTVNNRAINLIDVQFKYVFLFQIFHLIFMEHCKSFYNLK